MNRRKFIKRGALWVAAGGIIPAKADVLLRGSATLKGSAIFNQQVAAGGGPTVAPVFMAGSNFSAFTGGSTTLNLTATVLSGSNRLMLIAICQGNSGGGVSKTINSVTWNGAEVATPITGFSKSDGNFCSIDGFYIVAPSVATSVTLAVVFATAPTISCVLVSTYTGAAQSSIFGTAVTGTAANTTATVNAVTGTGQINWGGTCTDANSALTIGGTATTTQRQASGLVSADMEMAIGEASGTGTFQWSWAGADNGWAMCTVPVNGL